MSKINGGREPKTKIFWGGGGVCWGRWEFGWKFQYEWRERIATNRREKREGGERMKEIVIRIAIKNGR